MLKKTDGEKSPTDSPAEDTDHENDVTDKYEIGCYRIQTLIDIRGYDN